MSGAVGARYVVVERETGRWMTMPSTDWNATVDASACYAQASREHTYEVVPVESEPWAYAWRYGPTDYWHFHPCDDADDYPTHLEDHAEVVPLFASPVPRVEPLVYLRRKVVDAIMDDLREGESGTVADHMWLNPDAEDIAVRDLVPLFTSPRPSGEADQ